MEAAARQLFEPSILMHYHAHIIIIEMQLPANRILTGLSSYDACMHLCVSEMIFLAEVFGDLIGRVNYGIPGSR